MPIYKRVVEIRKELFGNDDLYTVNDIDNLANTLSKLGRYEEALPLCKQVLKYYKENYGTEDMRMLNYMYIVAIVLSELEKYDEASKLFKKILTSAKKAFGKTSKKFKMIYEEVTKAQIKYEKPKD